MGTRSTQIPDGEREFFAWLAIFSQAWLEGLKAGFVEEDHDITFNIPGDER